MAHAPWPPDVWVRALQATSSTAWVVCNTKIECVNVCETRPGWRTWAFDLPHRAGTSNNPKRFIAAPVDVFLAAYELVPVPANETHT